MKREQQMQEEAEIDERLEELMRSGGGEARTKREGFFRRFFRKLKGMSRRKKAVLAGAAVLLALFFIGSRNGNKSALPRVAVAPLTKQDIRETLSISGPVSGTDSVDVVSGIHAEILSMNVKEGDKVTKGQVLAVLDSTDLERELQIAENAWRSAVVAKEEKDKEAALGYEKACQDYEKASQDYNRTAQLAADGYIAQTELEQSKNALNDARRQMESYTVEDGRGRADRSYELAVSNAAFELEKKREELEDTQIKSAIDGTVVRVNSKVGQFADTVEDDKPIFSIENLEQLELEIKVSEFSIGKVKVGQKAIISADILGKDTEEGRVTKISPTGEEKGGGSTERVIPTTIQIEGKDTKLIAGITARAELLIDEAEDTFVVPSQALFDNGEETCIAVVEEGKIRWIPVETGVDGDVRVQVLPTGDVELTEGMQLVTEPDISLADGMAVEAVLTQ